MAQPAPLAVIVMGVSGSGKSLLAHSLAEMLNARFIEADDLHSQGNRDKMAAGIPLTDADRWPWLDVVGRMLGNDARAGGTAIAACSALRQVYRDRLDQAAAMPIRYVHLDGTREVIAARMAARSGHFMNPALLDSQIATLETPTGANVLACDLSEAPELLLMSAIEWLNPKPSRREAGP